MSRRRRELRATGTWYDLAPAQQSLWLQEHAAPPGTSYQALAVMRCSPHLDRARLEKAAEALIAQNQSFWLEWSPEGLQRQASTPNTCFDRIPTTSVTPWEQLDEIRQWHESRSATYGAGIAVFHCPDGIRIASFSHHLANDGWTTIRCCERIAKNYALLEKNPDHVFTMDGFFLETLKESKAYLNSAGHARDAMFWQGVCAKMDGIPMISQLADHAPQPGDPYVVQSLNRTCLPALQEALVKVSASLSLSLAECVTALTAIYLAQYSAEACMTLGVVFHNRTWHTLRVPGLFAEVLPMTLPGTAAKQPVHHAVRAITNAFRRTLQHGRYPIVEMLDRHGLDPRHTEVSINTLFLKRSIRLDGEPTHLQWLTGPESGLSFFFTQFGRDAPLEVALWFNRARFETATIERHADRLLSFLETACSDLAGAPHQRQTGTRID